MQTHYLKTWMVLPLAVALAGALLALAIVASGPAEAAGKFKFVTKTFNQPASVSIPSFGKVFGPASPYPSTKNVGGFPKGARIVDVNLTLKDFRHQSPAETDFLLAHAGVNRTVMSDAGGIEEVVDLNITLDDQASAQLPSEPNDPLTSGKFKPANFDGNGEGFDPRRPPRAGCRRSAASRAKTLRAPGSCSSTTTPTWARARSSRATASGSRPSSGRSRHTERGPGCSCLGLLSICLF